MQGVALIRKGKAERRHDMSCYGNKMQNEAMAKNRNDRLRHRVARSRTATAKHGIDVIRNGKKRKETK